MKVSQELIEKYHLGRCSAEERALVEAWLFGDSFEEAPEFPHPEQREEIREKIWEEIAPTARKSIFKSSSRTLLRLFPAAAACLAVVVLAWRWGSGESTADGNPVIVVSNLSEVSNRDVNADSYRLSLAPGSNVRIDPLGETMELCGTLSFVPAEDVTLKIVGECPKGESPETVVSLKSGANYIAFSYYDNTEKTELIVVEEDQLNTLPSFIQKQLVTLFKI
ncbi:MAG: hypothetical protein ABS46_03305 [Cytophagaceae bacterium SCN 52-12]|nr:MAG: hypothetical protein ABS46_03305 [Cytophagaceae bacterium SCN 52-12]